MKYVDLVAVVSLCSFILLFSDVSAILPVDCILRRTSVLAGDMVMV